MALEHVQQMAGIVRGMPGQPLHEVAEHEAAFAGRGVHAHHRMLGLEQAAGEDIAVALRALLVQIGRRARGGVVVVVAVDGAQPVGQRLQIVGQALVGRRRVGPDRVAAIGRDHHRPQDRHLRIGDLEGHVGIRKILRGAWWGWKEGVYSF